METAMGTGLAAEADGKSAGRAAASEAMDTFPDDRVDFCQVFCSIEYDYEAVRDGIRSVIGPEADLIGCSTAQAFTEAGVGEGVIVGLVRSDTLSFSTGMGTGLGESVPGAVRDAIAEFDDADGPYRAAITLHDGLAGVGEELVLEVRRKLGPNVPIIGGAAADDHRLETTHVFDGDRVAEDAVVLALIDGQRRPVASVDHGHEPLSEPVEVTRAEGSIVYELDGRPAFAVWKDAVRDPVAEAFDVAVDDLARDSQLLGRIMCEFEFGIDQGDRYKMRWPWVEPETGDALHFAVDVPEGTVLRVMHGSKASQIESARRTVRSALAEAEDPIAGAFVYDCACRAIVLGEELGAAVDAMAEELAVPMVGFETYGEMCMGLGQLSGFHNTTTVCLLLPE